MVVLDFIFSVLVSFLPERHRRWYASDPDLYRAALVSGLLQYFGSLLVLFTRYISFMQSSVEQLSAAAVAHRRVEALGTLEAQYGGMGFAILAEFLLSPVTLLLFYMAIEGLVRFAAAATRDVLGTAPVCIALWTYERTSAWAHGAFGNSRKAHRAFKASANK